MAILVSTSFAVVTCAPSAHADSVIIGYDSEGNPIYSGDSAVDPDESSGVGDASPYAETEEQSTVKASVVRCEAGKSVTLTNLANPLKVDWADSVKNGTSRDVKYTVKAESSETSSWSVSVSVSAEASAAIFAKVSATINGSIARSKTTTYGSQVEVTVSPHKTVKADRGMWQEKVAFKYYSIDTACRERRSSGTASAPYRQAWHIY